MFYKQRRPSGRVRPLLLALSLLFTLLVSVLGQEESDRPILLTDITMLTNGGWNLTLPYMNLDQCFPAPGVPNLGSYGLIVRRPPGYACPVKDQYEEGLLICYPGQLQHRSTSLFVSEVMYYIPNRNNNSVAAMCQKKRREFCSENPEKCKPGGVGSIPWHGIRLTTEEIAGIVSVILQLSITNRNYTLPLPEDNQERFWLKFGTQKSLETVLAFPPFLPEEGPGMMPDHYINQEVRFDKKISEYFLANVNRGARFIHYDGLWLLAVDFLPSQEQHNVHLFVYRSCQCTLQAWYTRPIDIGDPIDAKLSAGMEPVCEKKNFSYDVTTKLRDFHDGKTALFRVLTYKLDATVTINLLDEDNNIVLNIKASQTNAPDGSRIGILEFGGVGKWDNPIVPVANLTEVEKKRATEGKSLFVRIVNYGNLYVFILGDELDDKKPLLVNTFWPEKWQGKPSIGDARIHIEGKQLVGGVVEVVENSAPLAMIPPHSLKLDPTKSVANGTTIAFRAKVDDDAKSFQILMLHDAPEKHFYMGATVMLINVSLEHETVTWSAYSNGEMYHEKTEENTNFIAGHAYECLIVITQTDVKVENEKETVEKRIHFDVFVNGEKFGDFTGNLPIWTLNWIQFEGDIHLFHEPVFDFANETSGLFKHEFEHLLFDGDVLCIEAKMSETAPEEFKVFLFHEANEFNKKIGDAALQISYDKDTASFGMNAYLHDVGAWTEALKSSEQRITAGQKFSVTIEVHAGKFNISFMEATEEIVFGSDIPPWAANWLTVEGASKVELTKSCKDSTAGQKELPANILQLYPDKLLEKGDQIVVTGEVENGTHVEVFLFREALEWHSIIGQTVLLVQFDAAKKTIAYNSYIRKEWLQVEENDTNSQALKTPLTVGQPFELKIVAVEKKKFAINFGEIELQYEEAAMPIWAAQYIVVKGLKIPTIGEHKLVTIERKNIEI